MQPEFVKDSGRSTAERHFREASGDERVNDLTLQNKVDELRPVGRRLEGVKDIKHVSPELIERRVLDDGNYFVNVDFFPFVDLEVLSLLINR